MPDSIRPLGSGQLDMIGPDQATALTPGRFSHTTGTDQSQILGSDQRGSWGGVRDTCRYFRSSAVAAGSGLPHRLEVFLEQKSLIVGACGGMAASAPEVSRDLRRDTRVPN